jgi:hypothetical protein
VKRYLATAADNVWDRYIEVCCITFLWLILSCFQLQAHPKQKKWHKTSFLLFNDMADLIEDTYTIGKGIFHSKEPPSDSGKSDNNNDSNIDPTILQPIPSLISSSNTATAPSLPIVATVPGTGLSAPITVVPVTMPSTNATASGK